MEGFGAGFLEVAAAFNLGLKNRKVFMISDYGVEEEAHFQWREIRCKDWKWGKAQVVCVDQ